MGDRRARRPAVDYAAFDFDDDDDFVDSSSSSSSRGASQEKQQKKDKQKTKKEKSSRANDENVMKSEFQKEKKKKSAKELKEVDLNGGVAGAATLQSFLTSPNRRMERKSLDEKRFERELEMAMKMSKQVLVVLELGNERREVVS